ncbi:MAG: hypothetical protein AAGG75_22800 [Bacteroidota bacterium]
MKICCTLSIAIVLLLCLSCARNAQYEYCGETFPYQFSQQKKYDFKFTPYFQQGLQCAQEQHKPVLLVFSATPELSKQYPFESQLLQSSAIRTMLEEHYIVIYLNVDKETPLNSADSLDIRTIKPSIIQLKKPTTRGQLNTMIQYYTFQSNTVPSFFLLNDQGKVLMREDELSAKAYDPHVFLLKLQEGLHSTEDRK